MNVVATPFKDALPSMIGFAEERIGIPKCEWTSPCYLLADRDLALGEVIRVWAVDRRDGRVLKVVALKATAANHTRDKWPAAFIKAIRDDQTLASDSKLLHAGVIKRDFRAGKASHSTADCIAASSHEDYNRLWVFSTCARLFTNAPFAANQVVAHNLANIDFEGAQRLCVQVRDRVSQGLLESIVVTFEVATDPSARAKALCEAVIQNSEILRAGVLADDGITITLNDQGNALWIPQFSELSVSVAPAPWVLYDTFSASRALTADEELRVHIHDDVTGMQLAGSPFIFTASAEALDQGKWPAALAKKLKSSGLGDYLALELDKDSVTPSGQWTCAGVPLRILMSAPLEENNDWVPMLCERSEPDQPVSINEQILQIASLHEDTESKFIEVTLQDIRTGHVCYRLSLMFDTIKNFTKALVDGMRLTGIPEVKSNPHPSSSNKAASPEEKLTLWLPKRLGMTGALGLEPSAALWQPQNRPLFLNFLQPNNSLEYREYPPRSDGPSKGHHVDVLKNFQIFSRLPGRLFPEADAPAPENIPYQNLLLGGTAILASRFLQLKLGSKMINAGVRFLTTRELGREYDKIFGSQAARDVLFLSPPSPSSQVASVGIIGAYFTSDTPWHGPFELSLKPETDRIESFHADSTLCADRCMTLGAHVYDTGRARDNGVDENTGLFHAHYPVASLKGLGGKGPELDLTLHYSAVRANEGALGDGWAFRFSYFDNRRRVLTLSSGHTLTLTKAQMKSLSADKTTYLDQDGYRITAVEGNEDAWTALTIQMPAGSESRQEVLQLPATHDGKEASEAFKERYKEKLQKVIANLTHWIDKEKLTNDQITDRKKQREAWKTELAELDRKSLVLVTSSIRSAQGGEFKLAWQGIEGHIRLDSVKDAETVLLRANHGSIVLQGSSQSTFTVWPDTPENYEITLEIRNCLLESIKRYPIGQKQTPERHVSFNYEADPVLDRVLTCIAEEDGSLETVQYELPTSETQLAPRVSLHTLVPGSGQQSIAHLYEWGGEHAVEQLYKWQVDSAGEDAGPFVLTTWTFNDGARVIDSIVEEQPGASRRTTRFTYPATAPANDCKYLTLSRPIKTEVTTESLATTAEDAS